MDEIWIGQEKRAFVGRWFSISKNETGGALVMLYKEHAGCSKETDHVTESCMFKELDRSKAMPQENLLS